MTINFLSIGYEIRICLLWLNVFVVFLKCKDAVLVAKNQEAMEAARKKMQEELDTKAAIFREKQKQVQ